MFNLLVRHETESHAGCGEPCSRRVTPQIPVSAIMQAGQQIYVDSGDITVSGMSNAPKIKMYSLNAVFENKSSHRIDSTPTVDALIIDLMTLTSDVIGGIYNQDAQGFVLGPRGILVAKARLEVPKLTSRS